MSGWTEMSPERRKHLIEEVEKWLLYRGASTSWWLEAQQALLQEIYSLRKELNKLSQDAIIKQEEKT